MIVRILGEGQFHLSSAALDELNELDNRIVETVSTGDQEAFHRLFAQFLQTVRRQGQPLAVDDLRPSDVVLPGTDTSFAEARELFVEEGLIPG